MKTLATIKYLFTAIGIVMIVGALQLRSHTANFLREASVAQGTVVDLRRSTSHDSRSFYHPVVQFNAADGTAVEFVSSAGSDPPSYAKGETVKVFYQPTNPNGAMINGTFSLWGGSLIVGGLGTLFFLIGGGIIVFSGSGARRLKRLKVQGTPVVTRLQGVELNLSLNVNGVNPYRVVTQWLNPATGELHLFRSANLWYDPTDHLESRDITVYIEPGNPRRYAMDVSFLPKLAS
jgi:hypothetical protein